MDLNELNEKINNFFNITLVKFFKETLPTFFKDLPTLIKEFPEKFMKMTLGEQIAYGCIGLGGLLILISLFLF